MVLFFFAAAITSPLAGTRADDFDTRVAAAVLLSAAVTALAAGPFVAWRNRGTGLWLVVVGCFVALAVLAGCYAIAGGLDQL
ncbi:MAG: hypothetical protein ACRD2W_10450 [Acidimicrobiales bacterium]